METRNGDVSIGDHVRVLDLHLNGEVIGITEFGFNMVRVRFPNGQEKWVSALLLTKITGPIPDLTLN